MFGPQVDIDAKAHAIAQYPNEAVGLVAGGSYVTYENVAPKPTEQFQLPVAAHERIAQGDVVAVIHSHCAPQHSKVPGALDMRSQMEINLPFGIVLTDGRTAGDILWWGDFRLDDELIGREFISGVYDCYGLVRSWYWQERGIKLNDVPRDEDFWYQGQDLPRQSAPSLGFVKIEPQAAVPGDLVFMAFDDRSHPSHCAVLLDRGLILHHLPKRYSRREPLGPWRKFVTDWMHHAP